MAKYIVELPDEPENSGAETESDWHKFVMEAIEWGLDEYTGFISTDMKITHIDESTPNKKIGKTLIDKGQ